MIGHAHYEYQIASAVGRDSGLFQVIRGTIDS
jgi:hypothetical protein